MPTERVKIRRNVSVQADGEEVVATRRVLRFAGAGVAVVDVADSPEDDSVVVTIYASGTGGGPHALGGQEHIADTLEHLNSKLSDLKVPAAVGFKKITVSATEPVDPDEGDLWFQVV